MPSQTNGERENRNLHTKYDGEKIIKIREKIKFVFESECLLDDMTISERYNITSDGDLIMILR